MRSTVRAWVQDVLNGVGSPTLTWIPPGFPGYDATEKRWGFDPEAAKKALAESSYGSVDKLPPITADLQRHPAQPHALGVAGPEVEGGPGRGRQAGSG